MREGEITVDGEKFKVPEEGETLTVHKKGKDGKNLHVTISGVDTRSTINRTGGSGTYSNLRNTESQSATFSLPDSVALPPKVSVKDIQDICKWLPRGIMWKKDTLLTQLSEIHPGLTIEAVKTAYQHNQAENNWPNWEDLP